MTKYQTGYVSTTGYSSNDISCRPVVSLVDRSLFFEGIFHNLKNKLFIFLQKKKKTAYLIEYKSNWTYLHVILVQMFQALARDRLERLNASPSATPLTYFRVYSVLLFVFTVDIFWYCLIPPFSLSMFL